MQPLSIPNIRMLVFSLKETPYPLDLLPITSLNLGNHKSTFSTSVRLYVSTDLPALHISYKCEIQVSHNTWHLVTDFFHLKKCTFWFFLFIVGSFYCWNIPLYYHVNCAFSIVFHSYALSCWGHSFIILAWWVVREGWILSNVFSASVEMIIWFYTLLITIMYYINWSIGIKPTCILGISPTFSEHTILSIYCWIWCAVFHWGFSAPTFIPNIDL